MGEVIGICNQKGGTGKTTTAINLATFLALAKKRTLLIDMDPQANSTSGLGIEAEPNIYDTLIRNVPIENIIKNHSLPFLYIIPSSISLTGAEIELIEFYK